MDRSLLSRAEVYRNIASALAHLVVFDDGEVISMGTGFVFTPDGALLTAAHVVAGGFPVKPGEVKQASRVIVAFLAGQKPILYKPIICPFEIRCPAMKPMQLDLAVLVPQGKLTVPLKHLTASLDAPILGDEMYFAGYSNEVEFPLLADRYVLPNTAGLDILKRALQTGVKERIAGPLIKRGTVGNVRFAQFSQPSGKILQQSFFYLDNQIHEGASGGPIVGTDGLARGVVCKRMIAKVGEISVPSGSTLGIGLEPLLAAAVRSSDAA